MSEEKKGCGYLTCLPPAKLFLGLLSVRLGSLIISIYSIIHSIVGGYNADLLGRRELEININAVFCFAFAFVSLLLMVGVCTEQQGLVLLWLWFVVIMFIPMLLMLAYVASIHFAMKMNALAYRNTVSCGMHILLLYFLLVVHGYRVEIEALEDMEFDEDE